MEVPSEAGGTSGNWQLIDQGKSLTGVIVISRPGLLGRCETEWEKCFRVRGGALPLRIQWHQLTVKEWHTIKACLAFATRNNSCMPKTMTSDATGLTDTTSAGAVILLRTNDTLPRPWRKLLPTGHPRRTHVIYTPDPLKALVSRPRKDQPPQLLNTTCMVSILPVVFRPRSRSFGIAGHQPAEPPPIKKK